jgi:hypothetical protein
MYGWMDEPVIDLRTRINDQRSAKENILIILLFLLDLVEVKLL